MREMGATKKKKSGGVQNWIDEPKLTAARELWRTRQPLLEIRK
jgi:hypothetical protein